MLLQTMKQDFYAYKKTLMYIPVYILIFPLFFSWIKDYSGMFSTLAVLVGYMWVGSVMAYDEKYRAPLIYGPLPVKRETVVLGKYLSGNFVFLAVSLVFCVLGAANMLIPDYPVYTIPDLAVFAVAAFGSCAFSAVMLPLIYAFGYQKSRVILVIFMGVFIGISVFGAALLSPAEQPVDFLQKDIITSLILILAAILIQVLSYHISCRIYCQKDL